MFESASFGFECFLANLTFIRNQYSELAMAGAITGVDVSLELLVANYANLFGGFVILGFGIGRAAGTAAIDRLGSATPKTSEAVPATLATRLPLCRRCDRIIDGHGRLLESRLCSGRGAGA